MNVAIRTDASTDLGTGHVMRCLTLAKALRGLGATVTFLTREGPGGGNTGIARDGFAVRTLPETRFENGRLAAAPEDEIASSLALLAELGRVDLLMVDQYSLDSVYERAMRAHCSTVAVIDDLADREHDCDLLLDQNITALAAGRYDGLLPAHCVRLLGPRFALLRDEFAEAARGARVARARVERVLVTFGGYDATNESAKAVRAIDRALGGSVDVDVLLAPQAPHVVDVARLCAALPRARIAPPGSSVSGLMVRADLAVGASGGTVWERAYLGLPSIVLTVAENQVAAARACSAAGVVAWPGDARDVDETRLAAAIGGLASDRAARQRMAELGQAMMGTGEKLGTMLVAERLVEVATCS